MPTSRRLSNLAILALIGCVAVYAVALGTRWGLRMDRQALPHGVSGPRWEHAHAALHVTLESLTVATMAVVGGATIIVALRRGRRDLALAAAAVLVGANVTTAVLKPLLGLADPLGGDALRVKGGAYPSGHATAAMSLALSTVLVAPRRWRLWVAAGASTYVAAVGVALVALVWHQPSDVVGGFLVAVAWSAGVASVVAASRERSERPALGRRLLELALWGGASAVTAGAILVLLRPAIHFRHGPFAVAALIIAGLALVLPVALATVLGGGSRTRWTS